LKFHLSPLVSHLYALSAARVTKVEVEAEMLLFLLDGGVISGTLSHNMVVQGVLERFVSVNSPQGHRNNDLHDPRVKAALIIILYTVTDKSYLHVCTCKQTLAGYP